MLLVKNFYRGVARNFQRRGGTNGGGGQAVSHPGHLPVWYVHIQAVFYYK